MAGVDALADAVEVTLGPKGRNVMIEQSFGGPKITKDGVTVAKSIEFKDKAMNLGASLIKSVASTTNDIAGDGTTTATLLTRAILKEGLKSVAAGMNPMDLKRGVDTAVASIVENLKARATNISTAEEIAQVRPHPFLMLLCLLLKVSNTGGCSRYGRRCPCIVLFVYLLNLYLAFPPFPCTVVTTLHQDFHDITKMVAAMFQAVQQ